MPPTPREAEVIAVLRRYRAEMDAREAGMMEQMTQRWLGIEGRLQSDMALLAQRMSELQQAGQTPTIQMVWKMEQYQKLRTQIQNEVEKYNRWAVEAISDEQRAAATLGLNAAQESLSVSLGPLSQTWGRLPVSATETMIGFAQDGSPLYRLLQMSYPDSVDGLLSSLINGVARGQGVAQTAQEMADGFGMGLQRALLIARTETRRTYTESSINQYQKSGVVASFKRLVKKETACMACLALDGQTFRAQGDLNDHPRGKCMVVPCVEGVAPPTWETGAQWFKNLPKEDQIKRMGQQQYDLWKAGDIKFADFARWRPNPTWGTAPRVTTLEELLKKSGKTAGGAGGAAAKAAAEAKAAAQAAAAAKAKAEYDDFAAFYKGLKSDPTIPYAERFNKVDQWLKDHRTVLHYAGDSAIRPEDLYEVQWRGVSLRYSMTEQMQKNVNYSLSQLEDIVANHPKAEVMFKPLKRIFLTKQSNLGDAYWSQKWGHKVVSGACAGDREIHYFHGAIIRDDVFLHELGHIFDQNTRGQWYQAFTNLDTLFREFERGRGAYEAPISLYGRHNQSEDFAEAVSTYFVKPAVLKRHCPKRYAILQGIFH